MSGENNLVTLAQEIAGALESSSLRQLHTFNDFTDGRKKAFETFPMLSGMVIYYMNDCNRKDRFFKWLCENN